MKINYIIECCSVDNMYVCKAVCGAWGLEDM